MSLVDNPYVNIITAIEAAGFYVSGPNQYVGSNCRWNRIIPSSKLRPLVGYTGNSFWISLDEGAWYIGVWGGRIYGISDASKIASMAIEWMSAKPNDTFHDFDSWLVEKYGLYEIDENDFRPTRLMSDRNE